MVDGPSGRRAARAAGLPFVFRLWLCVWLLVTLLNALIAWTGMCLPPPVHSLLLSGVMVPTMVYVVIPLLGRGRRRSRP